MLCIVYTYIPHFSSRWNWKRRLGVGEMVWCQGAQNIGPSNRKLKSTLECTSTVWSNALPSQTNIRTDGRTNIVAIARRFVLTNASRANKKEISFVTHQLRQLKSHFIELLVNSYLLIPNTLMHYSSSVFLFNHYDVHLIYTIVKMTALKRYLSVTVPGVRETIAAVIVRRHKDWSSFISTSSKCTSSSVRLVAATRFVITRQHQYLPSNFSTIQSLYGR